MNVHITLMEFFTVLCSEKCQITYLSVNFTIQSQSEGEPEMSSFSHWFVGQRLKMLLKDYFHVSS